MVCLLHEIWAAKSTKSDLKTFLTRPCQSSSADISVKFQHGKGKIFLSRAKDLTNFTTFNMEVNSTIDNVGDMPRFLNQIEAERFFTHQKTVKAGDEYISNLEHQVRDLSEPNFRKLVPLSHLLVEMLQEYHTSK